MSFSLHAATVPSYIQMLGAMQNLLGKARDWCVDEGVAEADLLGRRIAPDMHPLSYQVKSTVVHSIGAIEGVRRGTFSPDNGPLPDSIALLEERLAGANETLRAIDPAEMESWIGRDMTFAFGEHRIGFTADDFLLSFSQPNFYFHCTTAYAILRGEGLGIGKRDFMGQQRRKAHA